MNQLFGDTFLSQKTLITISLQSYQVSKWFLLNFAALAFVAIVKNITLNYYYYFFSNNHHLSKILHEFLEGWWTLNENQEK